MGLFASTAQAGIGVGQPGSYFQKPYPDLSTLQQVCKVGTAIKSVGAAKPGEMPVQLDGITTISAAEAKCVFDRYQNSVLFIDAAGEVWVKDAFPMVWAARKGTNDEIQREVVRVMGNLTNKQDKLPIIVYCHHVRCGLSPEVSRRIRAAGYGPVLWMREGIDVWRTSGYPTVNELPKWVKFSEEKVPALRACFEAQKLPGAGTDWEAAYTAMFAKCGAQEAAYRAAMTPFFVASQVEGSTKSKRKAIAESSPHYRRFNAEFSRRRDDDQKARLAKMDAELQMMRGIGVPARDKVAGFEICWAAVDTPKYQRFFIYSDVYPAEIGKFGLDNLMTFNRINDDSVRGTAFIKAIRLPQHLVDLGATYRGQNGCEFYRTRAEADATRTRRLSEAGGRNLGFSWRP